MFAVVKTGGKQYRVEKDTVFAVEKLDANPGDKITLDQVLMFGDEKTSTVGAPLVAGASVQAEIVDQKRSNKVIVFKKKRRQNYRRKHGHRQAQTVLKVTGINAPK